MTDDERLEEFARSLANEVEQATPVWVQRVVASRVGPDQLAVQAEAIQALADDVGSRVSTALNELLGADIDAQRTTPLAIVRGVVPQLSAYLHSVGAPKVGRDAHARELHPNDDFALTPAGFEDFGEGVREASMLWGAAKAHVHIQRRKNEGLR